MILLHHVGMYIQAQQEEGGKTLVRWAFRFSPSQAGSDRFVPFILSGTNLYVEELEKLAATWSRIQLAYEDDSLLARVQSLDNSACCDYLPALHSLISYR